MQKTSIYILLLSILLVVASCGNRNRDNRENPADTVQSNSTGFQENNTGNAIDENIYNRLSQYVKAYYVKAYIEKKEYTIARLNQNTTDNPIPTEELEKIINELPEIRPGKTENLKLKTKGLYNVIKDKNINPNLSKQKAIEGLLELPGDYKKFLEDATTSLKTELTNKVSDSLFNKNITTPPDLSNNNVSQQQITLNKSAITLKVGEKNRLTVDSITDNLGWESSDLSVVTVNEKGVIEALKEGKAAITATVRGTNISDTCEVTVEKEGSLFKSLLTFLLIICLIAAVTYFLYPYREKIKKILSPVAIKIQHLYRGIFSKAQKKVDDDNDEEEPLDSEHHNIELEYKQLKDIVTKYGEENGEFRIKNKNLEARIRELEKRNKELELIIEQLGGNPQNTEPVPVIERIIPETVKEPSDLSEITTLYADAIIDGAFHRVRQYPDEDTVFELQKTTLKKVQFFIYPDAYRRVLKNPDFVDGCEKQVISLQAQMLEVENGEAIQDDFGKWVITQKAKVRFV